MKRKIGKKLDSGVNTISAILNEALTAVPKIISAKIIQYR